MSAPRPPRGCSLAAMNDPGRPPINPEWETKKLTIRLSGEAYARLLALAEHRGWVHGGYPAAARAAREAIERGLAELEREDG